MGVRTPSFTDESRTAIVNTTEEGEPPIHDRAITGEVRYPAAPDTPPGVTCRALPRDGETEMTLSGRAARDIAPAEGSFPAVIIAHGHPGHRLLMTRRGETLASGGHGAASIDHPDSPCDDRGIFAPTRVHRPVDQRFVPDETRTTTPPRGSRHPPRHGRCRRARKAPPSTATPTRSGTGCA